MNEQEYPKLAKQAIKAFDQGEPLTDAVIKIARSKGLNPEQCKRLVERTNVMTHMYVSDKMAKAKAEDRYVEFETADPAKVLDALGHTKKKEKTEKKASARPVLSLADVAPLPFDFSEGPSSYVKTAEEECEDKEKEEKDEDEDEEDEKEEKSEKEAGLQIRTPLDRMALKEATERLEDRLLSNREKFHATMHKLAQHVSSLPESEQDRFWKDIGCWDTKFAYTLRHHLPEIGVNVEEVPSHFSDDDFHLPASTKSASYRVFHDCKEAHFEAVRVAKAVKKAQGILAAN